MTNRADPSAPTTHQHRVGAATTVGHRRQTNEDAHFAGPRTFLVADGMGGHRAGDVASQLAVDVLRRRCDRPDLTVESLTVAIRETHHAIVAAADEAGRAGMGTTLVGAAVVDRGHRPAVAIFHLGDARCYRLVDGQLGLVTHDHTHVQELVDAGLLEPDAVGAHPLRNVVTRALGIDIDDGPEVTLLDPPIGRLLLCSDGLSNELSSRTIGRVLAGIDDPQATADRLIELALAGAARDNVTAVVVDLDLDASPLPPVGGDPRETGTVDP